MGTISSDRDYPVGTRVKETGGSLEEQIRLPKSNCGISCIRKNLKSIKGCSPGLHARELAMNEEMVRKYLEEAKRIIAGYFKERIRNSSLSISDVYPIEIGTDVTTNEITPDIQYELSELYEKMIPRNLRKDSGRFYTNDNRIIKSMINSSDVLSGKILEPACGTGLFLANLFLRIVNLMTDQGYSSEEILDYVTNNIYGNDIDVYALKIAEVNVLATLLPILIDAVNKNENYKMNKIKLFNYDYTQKECFRERFSLIIGNPPYVTLYGKRSRNMNEEKRAYYNTFDFVQNKNGNNKFNLCMFFVENGLKNLANNGSLYYILDICFFETAFVDLRKYIVENYYIDTITRGLQEFDDVASGQILIKISKRAGTNKAVEFIDYEKGATDFVDQKIWDSAKNKYKYLIPFKGLDKEINKKVRRFNRLDYYYPSKALRTCCVLTGRTEDFIVDPNEETSFEVYPYIEGSKGLNSKFGELSEQRYIKYDYDLQIKISDAFKKELEIAGVKNKKRVTLGDKEIYDAPKIFIRQSAFEIISTYTAKPYAANNSIYVLSNKDYSENGKKMLKYVCGILNSDLITYYCRCNNIIRAEKGKAPQIKLSDLKDVRICYDDKYRDEMVALVEKLLGNTQSDEDTLERLNQLVYTMYGITEDEADYIMNYITSNKTKAG